MGTHMSSDKEAKELRRFGVVVGGIFAVIAIFPLLFRGDKPRGWAALIAGALIMLGLAVPRALRLAYRLWMRAGHLLGWFNTRLLLGVVYFLVMTPMGMVMRLVGRDPLDRRLRDRPSYWVERQRRQDPKHSMELHF
jgi:hypothetical protein